MHWGWGCKDRSNVTILGKSVFCWNVPVPTSHSSARPWQRTPKSPWVCVQLKSFVHRTKESPLLLEQTKEKATKITLTEQGKRKGFKCMEKWATYLISPCSASVQSKPPTFPHRYKGVTCSCVHQQPNSCLKIGLSTTLLGQPAANSITQLCPRKASLWGETLFTWQTRQARGTNFTVCFGIVPFSSAASVLSGVGLPPPHTLVIVLLLWPDLNHCWIEQPQREFGQLRALNSFCALLWLVKNLSSKGFPLQRNQLQWLQEIQRRKMQADTLIKKVPILWLCFHLPDLLSVP